MEVNVSGLVKDIESSIKIDGSIDIRSMEYRGDEIRFLSPVKVDGTVTNSGDYLLLQGSISSTLLLKCSRCLEDFKYDLKTDFEERLSNNHKSGSESDDTIYFTGDIIELDQIVMSNLLLSLPMRFLCSEDCRGIYHGSTMNSGGGDSGEHMTDPRFDVLRGLFKDK